MVNEKITLWCNVKGDPALFKINVGIGDDVGDLKELIHTKCKQNILSGIDAKDLVLWKVRRFYDTYLEYTQLSLQPTIQINRIPESTCAKQVQAFDLPTNAIKLDAGCKVAAIFSQFLSKESLEDLRKDEEDPLEIPAEHDPQKLGGNRLFMKHLHIVVEHPPAGEFELFRCHHNSH